MCKFLFLVFHRRWKVKFHLAIVFCFFLDACLSFSHSLPISCQQVSRDLSKKKKNGKTKQLKWLVKSQAEKRAETAFMGPSKMPAYKVIKLLSLCLFFFFFWFWFFLQCAKMWHVNSWILSRVRIGIYLIFISPCEMPNYQRSIFSEKKKNHQSANDTKKVVFWASNELCPIIL